MKTARVKSPQIVDSLAQTYIERAQAEMIIEVILDTRGTHGETVQIHVPYTKKTVIDSAYIRGVKVARFTATEWQRLRSTAVAFVLRF